MSTSVAARLPETAIRLYFEARLAFSDRPGVRLRTRTGQAWNYSYYVWITAFDEHGREAEDQCLAGGSALDRKECVERLVRKFDWAAAQEARR